MSSEPGAVPESTFPLWEVAQCGESPARDVSVSEPHPSGHFGDRASPTREGATTVLSLRGPAAETEAFAQPLELRADPFAAEFPLEPGDGGRRSARRAAVRPRHVTYRAGGDLPVRLRRRFWQHCGRGSCGGRLGAPAPSCGRSQVVGGYNRLRRVSGRRLGLSRRLSTESDQMDSRCHQR
jgi:hypothetical protein